MAASSLLRSTSCTSLIEASLRSYLSLSSSYGFKVSSIGFSHKSQIIKDTIKQLWRCSFDCFFFLTMLTLMCKKCNLGCIQPIKAAATETPPTVQKSPSGGKTKIGINGFGWIGRLVLRVAIYRDDIDVVAVKDPFIDTKYMAYMFKYDSTHGVFKGTIRVVDESTLEINGKRIKVIGKRDPAKIPWGDYGAEFVVESSGVFTTIEKASAHMKGGAKIAVISSPSADAPIFVVGINEKTYKPSMDIVSNASCTTNCLAPLAKIGLGFDDNGACYYCNAKDLQLALPRLLEKFCQHSMESLLEWPFVCLHPMSLLTCLLEKSASYEDVKAAIKFAAEGPLKGILGYTDEVVVSNDFAGDSRSSIFDAKA
ncbi:hypothetical protein SLA2020_436510 [Shorea laevis]